MNRLIRYYFVTILFCLLIISCDSSKTDQKKIVNQEIKVVKIDKEKITKTQDTINVNGKIIRIISNGYCGIVCAGGLIEVKMKTQQLNYPDTNIYLITACMNSKIKSGLQIKVKSSKLKISDTECYYKNFAEEFSTRSNYYKLSEAETAKIHY